MVAQILIGLIRWLKISYMVGIYYFLLYVPILVAKYFDIQALASFSIVVFFGVCYYLGRE
jgi:hypothetical protein